MSVDAAPEYSEDFPALTEGAALGDREFFTNSPLRRFRGRAGDDGIWIIRRSGQVLLRTFTYSASSTTLDADDERALARKWYAAAYPSWGPERVKRAARKALRKNP